MMSQDATPQAAAANTRGKNHATVEKKDVANGSEASGTSKAMIDALWRLITGLTLAGVVGLFALLWQMNTKVAELHTTMNMVVRELGDLEIPPPWFEARVNGLEDRLEQHLRAGG